MRILSVVRIKAYSRYGYDYLKEITLCRADHQEYMIPKKDFKNLYPSDFEDLNLMLLQGHLNHLPGSDIRYEYTHDYTIIESPRAVVFLVSNNERKIMRFNEIYKFSDGTLTNILEALDYRVKEYNVNRFNPDSRPEGSTETWNALLVDVFAILTTDFFREWNDLLIPFISSNNPSEPEDLPGQPTSYEVEVLSMTKIGVNMKLRNSATGMELELVQVKMEMELPHSSGVYFITACSYSTDTANDLVKAQVYVSKLPTTNNQAFTIKKGMSMPVQMSQAKDGERPQVDDQRLDLADDLKEAQDHISRGDNVADLLTKGFDAGRFQYLVSKSKTSSHVNRVRDTKIPQSSGPPVKVGDEAVHKELGDRMERAATTASSLEAEHDSGSGPRCQDIILGDVDAQTRFVTTSKQSNDPPLLRGYTLRNRKDNMKLLELMELCTKLSNILHKNRKSDLVIMKMHPNKGGALKTLIRMLKDIDREDLQTLWKLVKTKYGDIRPEDEHERVLWGDLKVMFKPDIKTDVWRNLQGYKVTIWKLFNSCGVHFVRNLKIQKMNIKFKGGLLGLKRLQGLLELLLLSIAGTKVYVDGLQLLEDLLLSRG
ncbi:hypothetical protein Tco_0321141 [Tanacetum coccineum]